MHEPDATRVRAATAVLLAGGAIFAFPDNSWAGMPDVRLWEQTYLSVTGRQRLEVVSFFAVVYFVLGGVVQSVWNAFRKDFPKLPRLSYLRALGVLLIWSMLFLTVLTMISGARELMTPGAWNKSGSTYQLISETRKR